MNTYKMFPMFNEEEAVSYIVRRRAVFFPLRKIARKIAFRHDLDYTYALQFVLHIEGKYGKRIVGARLFAFLLLSGAMFSAVVALLDIGV